MPEQAAAAPSRTAVDPRESSLARFGRMQNSLEQVPLTTVHWHAHPVGSVCFSADGTLLLSGGEEAVLVGCHNVLLNNTCMLVVLLLLVSFQRHASDTLLYAELQALSP